MDMVHFEFEFTVLSDAFLKRFIYYIKMFLWPDPHSFNVYIIPEWLAGPRQP